MNGVKEAIVLLVMWKEHVACKRRESGPDDWLPSATSLLEQPDFVNNHRGCLYVESKGMRNLKSPPIQLLTLGRTNGGNVVERLEWTEARKESHSEDYVMGMWAGGGNNDRSLKRCLLGQPQGNGETETQAQTYTKIYTYMPMHKCTQN